jgi:hypothetical protein
MENEAGWHGSAPNDAQRLQALADLADPGVSTDPAAQKEVNR